MKLTFAFCTYNRAGRLEKLVQAMRRQRCRIPFEILAVNNDSSDDTLQVLSCLTKSTEPRLRVVTETDRGIVPARNRAIRESLDSDILVFIDDDELPMAGLLEAACDAILNEGADCVGGRIVVNFGSHDRPSWLGDELLGFLAETDYGNDPFWISDHTTPIWTANVGYDMHLFRKDPTLRFDNRYNRSDTALGGGEDAAMFRVLLARGVRIRYQPGMVVEHFVEPWRLRRAYFLRLHYVAGRKLGLYAEQVDGRTVAGVPRFLLAQATRQLRRASVLALRGRREWLRTAMNFTHTVGMIVGHYTRAHRKS